ncbi:hypothetical protein OCT63_19690 [Vibrio sp. RW]|uniref:hypothetical protein n=1 Tax=Vibrio sp. RW TaxID=2998833 RepID=UPI0022CD6272|nr:hypothetical protein [Vibrio sp. RW]MDA0146453.1 hypothetical protein [Vibrio sp. RW]
MENVFCSIEAIKSVVKNETAVCLVWPNELVGNNPSLSKPQFTAQSKELGLQPLMLDKWSANVLSAVYDALKEEFQTDIRSFIARDRANFARFLERALTCVN